MDTSLCFFNLKDHEARIREAGFDFESIEPESLPPGTLGAMVRQLGHLGPMAAMRLQGRFDTMRYEAILQQGPALVQAAKLDGVIVDQADACSGSLAEAAKLPWVSVASGLCMNSEPCVPSFLTSFAFSHNPLTVWRNRLINRGLRLAMHPTQKLVNRYRRRWGLRPLSGMDETFSPIAQICQQSPEFDYPRSKLPTGFHYVGPIQATRTRSIDFPWDRLDGRPLIYASLGTLFNRHSRIYRLIAESCRGLDAQLVISLGGADDPERYRDLPGSPLVVPIAPQQDLLARAALTITHAGLNTTLESLWHGVPLVALPISFEQPGIAARIRWTGAGDFIPLSKVTPARLRACVLRVLGEERYRRSASKIGEKLRATRGRQHAAEIVESIICRSRPAPWFAKHNLGRQESVTRN